MIMKRLSFGAAAICLIAACVSACGSENTGTDPQATASEQQLGTVKPGDAAKALGISVWRTDAATSSIKGLNASGELIAAISIDSDAGLIRTTLPDVGTRSLKNPSDSTLSKRATEFADAAESDLKAAVENVDSVPVGAPGEVVNKSYWTYACYAIYSDCSMQCLYNKYYGIWHACECVTTDPVACPYPNYRIALHYN